jgi:hypothetical protein
MSFNITYTNQDDESGVHRSGFKWIYDNLIQLNNEDSNLLLDLYTDKTFNWDNTDVKLPYTQPWIGVCHHTFNVDFSENNLYNLIENHYFIESSAHCKGLIVLSRNLQQKLIQELRNRYLNIPVYMLSHPTELKVPQFSYNKFLNNNDKKIVHIGAWLRNVFFFYNLTLGTYSFASKSIFSCLSNKESLRKLALKGAEMDNYFCSNEFLEILNCLNPHDNGCAPICRGSGIDAVFNKWYCQFSTFINKIKDSVTILDKLNNDDYDELLTENIVIICLMDASAVNTLIECVARCTPIIVNKHPAVVEILGDRYPLYYNTQCIGGISDNYFLMNKEIDELLSVKGIIKKANDYLKKLDKCNLNIDTFISKLQQICIKANK